MKRCVDTACLDWCEEAALMSWIASRSLEVL